MYVKFAFKVFFGGDSAAIAVDRGCVADDNTGTFLYKTENSGKIQGIWFLKYCGYPVQKGESKGLRRPVLLYQGCPLIRVSLEDRYYCTEGVLSLECPLRTVLLHCVTTN